MNQAIEEMLARYNCRSQQDYLSALKEIIQEVALLGLSRGKFFEYAAFYGGTALRVLYQLDRFSEDMDFSLQSVQKSFDLHYYCRFIKDELQQFGFSVEISRKEKKTDSSIESAFIKANTLEHLLLIENIESKILRIPENAKLKIKLEIDTDPPGGATFNSHYLLYPIPFSVISYDLPSLFAGKIHALLCRDWKGTRVKGRDFYDFIWYVKKGVSVNLRHLAQRMKQSGHLYNVKDFTPETLKDRLKEKFTSLNLEDAKRDVFPFIKDPRVLDIWSVDFFTHLSENVKSYEG